MMFTRVIIRTSKNSSVFSPLLRLNNFSTTISVEPKRIGADSEIDENPNINKNNGIYNRNRIIQAAFASLHEGNQISTPATDDKLSKATTVDELLSVSVGSGVSRRHALRVVSILSEWSNSGKVQLKDFEFDPRFIRLCRILSKNNSYQKSFRVTHTSNSDDLAVVLSVTADDEAAQLIGSITVPQMVKIMTTLSLKKRRSTLLLRTISFNITRSTHKLNVKQCSDLLYAMAILNFPDENLLARIANDICINLQNIRDKSSIIGSILTSCGLIKYKNPELLDVLSNWILKNQSICRSQDLFSFFMTLAVVNFVPTNGDKLFKEIVPRLHKAETGKQSEWLDVVWSLVLLDLAPNNYVASIFNEAFLGKYQESSPLPAKLKILNIDAAAEHLLPEYDGLKLPMTSVLRNVKPPVIKDKSDMVDSIIQTLKNLIQSEQFIRTNINTGMGFYIDAELVFDKKGNPVPFENLTINKDLTRVAVMAKHYHDMTLGKVEPSGISEFYENILKTQGYKILSVPYTEFKPKDNVIQRVQYIEAQLKKIVNS